MDDNIKKILISSGINLTEAFNRFVKNEQLYEEMLIKFFETSTDISDLKKEIDCKNYEMAYYYAHSLKGLTGNLSLIPVYDLSCTITEMIKKKNYTDINKIYTSLQTEYNQMKTIIRSLYPQSKIV